MPRFSCPECGDKFNSRKKRSEHIQVEHGGNVEEVENSRSIGQKLREMFTFKRAMVIVGMLLMIGLPLGGTVFYSGATGSNSANSGGENTYSSNPPVGYSMRNLPEVDSSEMPSSQILSSSLSKDVQLNVLVRGGKEQIGRLKPAVHLQYSCDCPETVEQLGSIAQKYSGWVYVAPYRDMNATIALSGFRNLEKVDSVNRENIEKFICNSLNNQPLKCLSGEFETNSSFSSS